MLTRGGTVRLQIHSNFDMLDFVQVVSDRLGQMAGMDEDSIHWIGVAVREWSGGKGREWSGGKGRGKDCEERKKKRGVHAVIATDFPP